MGEDYEVVNTMGRGGIVVKRTVSDVDWWGSSPSFCHYELVIWDKLFNFY